FSSRRRHTRFARDWSSDVCSSDLRTMDSECEGRPTADYLWEVKNIVPILKVDKGLAAEQDGVQLMKPIDNLASLLAKAKSKNVFGTKMRSVIKQANEAGIKAIVAQQFQIGRD